MKKSTILILLLSLLLVILAGCSNESEEPGGDQETPAADSVETGGFSYSEGIAENGMWEDITALDYVELTDYKALTVPKDVQEVTDEMVQSEIDGILASFTKTNTVMDRAVVDGDTVNIDYVGSVDGVEFEGGSTGGNGAEVTIGVTAYIDDFLEQLIGHTPGENFDIEVTFPEEYGNEALNGKDAVFNITINHIVEEVKPELTDAFVAENLSADYGVSTVEALKEDIRSKRQEMAISNYIQNNLFTNSTVDSIPEVLITHQEESFLAYYEQYASSYGMELSEFISSYLQMPTVDDLLAAYKEENTQNAKFFLIIQAVAEAEDIQVTDEELTNYFKENLGVDDYAEFEANYGKPYLVMNVLHQNVIKFVTNQASME